jgi:2-dehydro-3-deoxygluconokinase
MSVGGPTIKKRIAILGECMVELSGTPYGILHQTFGGDTLNTALYLSRLMSTSASVCYISALGTDALSEGMLERFGAEGIDTTYVLRDPMRLPGLYLIQIDSRGERTFLYWRNESAARYLIRHTDFGRVAASLAAVDMVYLTGISLGILPPEDRATLTALLSRLASEGVTVAFDSNYRPRLWPSADAARAAIAALLPAARLILTSFDDEQRLWGDASPEAAMARLQASGPKTVVIKLAEAGSIYSDGAQSAHCPAAPVAHVVDTTAAGDSFNAGFLSQWIGGARLPQCCQAGHALAGTVVQYPGAIIPASAMPRLTQ